MTEMSMEKSLKNVLAPTFKKHNRKIESINNIVYDKAFEHINCKVKATDTDTDNTDYDFIENDYYYNVSISFGVENVYIRVNKITSNEYYAQ